MANRPRRWLTSMVGVCVLGFVLTASTSPLASATSTAIRQDQADPALRQLEAARARWRARPIPYYRLRVETFNPLLRTVTESDVRNGVVVVARGADGMPGVGLEPGAGPWGPSNGETVETLFDMIERMEKGARRVASRVSATYDARRGYPTGIYSEPLERVFDGTAIFSIKLTVSPAVPLSPVSPGEAYRVPVPARLLDPGRVYDAVSGSVDVKRLVRIVWPSRGDEISRRGTSFYWNSVGWKPTAGLAGDIIGTLRLPSSKVVYVLEFQHNGGTLYLLAEKQAVQIAR